MVNSPSTSTNKTGTVDMQTLINQTILQQWNAIGERLCKIEQKNVKKSVHPLKSNSRSAVTKNTKVVRQSDSTHTSNHSAAMHTNVTNIYAVPSTVSLPTLDRLRANDNIQKAVADRLTELQ